MTAFNLETCARPNILALEPYRCAREYVFVPLCLNLFLHFCPAISTQLTDLSLLTATTKMTAQTCY